MDEFIFTDPQIRQKLGQLSQAVANQETRGPLRLVKNTLNGGELAPELGARFDQQRYQTGLDVCLNMIPLPQGGVMRRPPLLGIAPCAGGQSQTRLVPFAFSATETRLLEFYQKSGGYGLRVHFSPENRWVSPLTIPWAAGSLPAISFAQSADVLYCAHPSVKPGKLMRYGDYDWRYQVIQWLPSIAAPVITGISHSSEEDQSGAIITNTYVATAIDGQTGQESPPSAPVSHSTYPLGSTFFNTIHISAVEGASEYRIYKRKGGVYGFIGRITGGLAFEDRNIGADTEDTPPNWKDPFAGAGNHPALVFLHQQRLGFASSSNQPMTFWFSQTGSYENMSASIPPDATDAIEATLASGDASRILWAVSDRQGLAFGTAGGEWILTSGEGAAITPQDLSFQPQTFYGSQPGLAAIRAGAALLYVQKGAGAIREYGYSFSEDRYQSSDLSLLARHILRGRSITSWVFQTEPYGICWMTLSDGTMAGLTYLREHDVIAWHRHETAQGSILQACVVPGFADQDTLCLLVNRVNPASGAVEQWLEYMRPMLLDPIDQGDSSYDYAYGGIISPCLGETQTQDGLTWELVKKINALTLRVMNAWPMRVAVQSQNAAPATSAIIPQESAGRHFVNAATWHIHLPAGHRTHPQIILTLDKPGTILGLAASVEVAGSSGTQGK